MQSLGSGHAVAANCGLHAPYRCRGCRCPGALPVD